MLTPWLLKLHSVLEKTANDVKGLVKHFHMVQTQLEQITKVQKYLLAGIPIQSKQACGVLTRGGISTQDLFLLKDILKELNKNLNWLKIILLAPLKGKRKRRNIKN